MNHGGHGVQTKEALGVVKLHKAMGGLTQKMIPHQTFKILYIPPSVLSVSSVVNSHFPF